MEARACASPVMLPAFQSFGKKSPCQARITSTMQAKHNRTICPCLVHPVPYKNLSECPQPRSGLCAFGIITILIECCLSCCGDAVLGCSPEDSVPIFHLQICYAVKILIPFRKGVLRYGLSTGGENVLSSSFKSHCIRNGPCSQANQRSLQTCVQTFHSSRCTVTVMSITWSFNSTALCCCCKHSLLLQSLVAWKTVFEKELMIDYMLA